MYDEKFVCLDLHSDQLLLQNNNQNVQNRHLEQTKRQKHHKLSIDKHEERSERTQKTNLFFSA